MGVALTTDQITAGMLHRWGEEFALHRDCEYLGHQSKNMIQVLVEHKGEMPARATGFKPMEIGIDAMLVERAILAIARRDPVMAHCLRGYHCGRGRKRNERWQDANALLRRAGLPRTTRAQYMDLVSRGFDEVKGILIGLARAA